MASRTRRYGLFTALIMLSSPVSAQMADDSAARPDPTAPIAGERSVLTSRGGLVIEPSIQYIHSSATQVAIDGFTVIPAIAIGLINVGEVQRNSFIAALALRYGLTSRLEAEVKVPWVWRDEQIRQRDVMQGSDFDIVQGSSGEGLGDVEFGLRYQFNRGVRGPVVVGGLRVKSNTGTGPFDVSRRALLSEHGIQVGEIYEEQPTGSGFWSVQPSLTLIVPSDPAVLHFSINYLWNVERDMRGMAGRINPGNAVGASLGLGLAINDRTSFSLGYDHAVVGRTRRDGDSGLDPTFKRINVGTALIGFSHRLSARRSLNIGIGLGATSAAPDAQISLRLPIRI